MILVKGWKMLTLQLILKQPLTLFTPRDDASDFGHIISRCWVEFNRQQSDGVVHTLTGEVVLLVSPIIYFDIPHYINDIISNEML